MAHFTLFYFEFSNISFEMLKLHVDCFVLRWKTMPEIQNSINNQSLFTLNLNWHSFVMLFVICWCLTIIYKQLSVLMIDVKVVRWTSVLCLWVFVCFSDLHWMKIQFCFSIFAFYVFSRYIGICTLTVQKIKYFFWCHKFTPDSKLMCTTKKNKRKCILWIKMFRIFK